MSDRPNALQMPLPPGGEDNALLANAWDANRQAYGDWLARDRQRQIELGYVDPATGQLTPEGWRAQAQTVAGGFGPADIGALGIGAIKTYHGSPHLFEPTPKNPLGEFRLDKIGTGEGSQVFGQGMYVAEAPGTAGTYRDMPSAQTLTYGDVPFRETLPEMPGASHAATTIQDAINNRGITPQAAITQEIAQRRKQADMWKQAGIDAAKRPADPAWGDLGDLRYAAQDFVSREQIHSNVADWLTTLDPAKFKRNTGHMYEVNLNAEPGDFLHWDKTVPTDHPVRDMLFNASDPHVNSVYADMRNAGKDARLSARNPDLTGQGAYYQLSKMLGNDTAASEALRNAGIPGIRYLDRGSRGGNPDDPGATHNHVIFNPEIMEIVRRYGIAGLIGGGAAATAAGGQGNQ